MIRIVGDTMVKVLTQCWLERGSKRHNLHRLLFLLGCPELLAGAIFHPEDARTTRRLIILISLSLHLSPETITHWVMFSMWTYGWPSR